MVSSPSWREGRRNTHLDEADGGRLFAEALTAKVESVLADETGLVGAEAAGKLNESKPK